MKIGLMVAKIGNTYRARIGINKIPEVLPCEEKIFSLIENDGKGKKTDDSNLSRTRGLINIIKEKSKEEARRRGIRFVENLDSDSDSD